MDRNIQIDTFGRFTQVSRETISSLIKYEDILINANEKLNLIGNSTIKTIWTRHFLDSAQVIDFIDKNNKILVDIGSGAGFPGIVLALVANDRKIPIKIKLIEKSVKKVKFLREVSRKLNLDIEILNQDIFGNNVLLLDEMFIARAFKPLKIILELMHNKAKNFKKVFIFMGKTGKDELLQASKSWDMEYKQRVSVTSKDSIIIEINKFKKK